MNFLRFIREHGPSYWLTRSAGWLSTVKVEFVKNYLISRFIQFYRVDMTSSQRQEPEQFQHFEDFFTRELKEAARPIDRTPNSIVSPVDGTVASWGRYTNNTIVQVKHTASNLFNLAQSDQIDDAGWFGIIYLAPKDYHRVHAPVTCELIKSSRMGGTRHSVNPTNHARIDGLYERNVRTNCFLETASGVVLLTMVGAMIVSSIQVTWDESGVENQPIEFETGDEMARFCLGSTVVLVVPDGIGELETREIGHPLKLGERIGSIRV